MKQPTKLERSVQKTRRRARTGYLQNFPDRPPGPEVRFAKADPSARLAISRNGTLWNPARAPGQLLRRLDVEGPDDVAPLLGFVGDELAKVGGREREHVATQISKPRLDLGISKASVDLLVELVDDLGRRGPRCADAEPTARLVATRISDFPM
jgi:hypothetical protein